MASSNPTKTTPKKASPALRYAGMGVAGLALASLVAWYFAGASSRYAAGNVLFSDDNGKSFFSDSADNLPPFSHKGREAVTARVFVDAAGKPFVGYLERYTEAGKVRAREMMAERAAGKGNPGRDEVLFANMELKRPTDAAWTRASDPTSAAIRKVMCPDQPTQPAMSYSPPGD